MNLKATAFILIIIVAALSGCIIENENPVITFDSDEVNFNKIEAHDSFDLYIAQGNEYFIEIRINENLRDRLTIETVGDTLLIDLDQDVVNLYENTLEATIVMPDLQAIDLSGACKATIYSGFINDTQFDCKVSGASELEGELVTGDIELSVSGASDVNLTGGAGCAQIDVSGASDADLRDFATSDTSVLLSGASKAWVMATGLLEGDLSGASRLYYYGQPTLGSMHLSGASKFEMGG